MGLVAILAGLVATQAAARGRSFRRPTEDQALDICEPLANIACRHLPMSKLGADLVDATKAVAATQAYLEDGPVMTRKSDPIDNPNQ